MRDGRVAECPGQADDCVCGQLLATSGDAGLLGIVARAIDRPSILQHAPRDKVGIRRSRAGTQGNVGLAGCQIEHGFAGHELDLDLGIGEAEIADGRNHEGLPERGQRGEPDLARQAALLLPRERQRVRNGTLDRLGPWHQRHPGIGEHVARGPPLEKLEPQAPPRGSIRRETVLWLTLKLPRGRQRRAMPSHREEYVPVGLLHTTVMHFW